MSEHLHTLTTLQDLEEFKAYLIDNKDSVESICALDTEGTDKEPLKSKCIGYSISLYQDEGFYIPLFTWTDERGLCTEAPELIPKEGCNTEERLYKCLSPAAEKVALEILNYMAEWRLIEHNAVYDVIILLKNFDINHRHSVYIDSMLLKHTISVPGRRS